LRTTFGVVEGHPVQIISPTPTPLHIETVDLSRHTAAEQAALIAQRAAEEAQRPFDLSQSPLLRAGLLRLGQEEHILFFTMHHIISDGWSMSVLIREVAALYEGFIGDAPPSLPSLPIQYADFSVWQQDWLQGEALEKQLGYWKEQLGGKLPVLKLPTARPRPAVQTFNGARRQIDWPAGLVEGLKDLSAKTRTTLFMTLLGGFQTLLHRYTGQHEIIVGSGIANRNRIETEALIGYFVNVLALRTDLSGDPSFRQLLERVREVTLGAYAHQDLPFEKLIEELQPVRDLSRPPLFQVMLVLQNTPHQALQLPGLKLELMDIESHTAKMDLTIMLTETERGLTGWLEYNTDLFDAAMAQTMVENLETLLRGVVHNPDQKLSELPISDGAEQEKFGGRISAVKIEAALGEHGAVEAALVVALDGERGIEERLVAYIVPAEGRSVSPGELRALAQEKLPEHMIPDAFVLLDELPLTPDGGVDWAALPPPTETESEADSAFVAPRTPTEEAVASVWKEVLELSRIGIHHKFFDIGGDSLKVVRVSLMLNEFYPDALTVVDLFKHNTIASISARIDEAHSDQQPVPAIQGFEL
jgi:hypothetical protein